MMASSASAPGKIMLTGEYAVLEGHVAVVAAIDRRALATVGSERSESPLIKHLAQTLAAKDPEAGERAAHIEVDSTALYADPDNKLGLGSSAAVAVAAAALALASDIPEAVMSLAFEAHARAQAERGARGSGADIAAASYGGVVAVRAGGVMPLDVIPLELPEKLVLVPVWTGVPADTATLVAEVQRGRREHKDRTEEAMAHVAASSRLLIDAIRAGDAAACVRAIAEGAHAHAALASATGVPLVTRQHKEIRALAASRGGASKPTGAGGGDIALAAFCDIEAAQTFRRDVALSGMKALDLRVDSGGSRLEEEKKQP